MGIDVEETVVVTTVGNMDGVNERRLKGLCDGNKEGTQFKDTIHAL